MRRSFLLIAIAVAVLVATAAPGIAKPGGGADVAHFDELGCDVAWYGAELGLIADPACRVHNVRTADGAYHIVLHGQIPDEWMDEFIDDGAPKTFEAGCLANYGLLVAAGWPEDMEWVFGTGVRRFTPDGKMTEVCHYTPEL
jgi:hypothetical protein